jgi:hypothetical protein
VETSAITEVAGGWRLGVSGWAVTRCFVDPAAFGLLVDGGTGDILRIYIRGSLTRQGEEGTAETFDPTDESTTLAPLLTLMGRVVDRVFIADEGALSIDFAGGSGIHVAPDAQYEAWELEGLGRLMLICSPGRDGPVGIWE